LERSAGRHQEPEQGLHDEYRNGECVRPASQTNGGGIAPGGGAIPRQSKAHGSGSWGGHYRLPGWRQVEFLLKRFKGKPPPTKKKTPLYLPITPQQAIFLPALFSVVRADVAEVQNFNGEDCRVITAGLMPELARSAKAEGFRAKMWVAPGYLPRRMEITQPDFVAVADIKDLRFLPSLPSSTWQPPTGVTDIYWTNSDMLDSVLFVVMNSLKMNESDQPWLQVK
jgi:hypothetical protein